MSLSLLTPSCEKDDNGGNGGFDDFCELVKDEVTMGREVFAIVG
jgi:hypothetical protein